MHMKHFAAILLAGISTIALQGASWAQRAPALKGEVRSAEEGAMGGVTVTAIRDKSTISVTAITDDQGRYSFPAAQLGSGASGRIVARTGLRMMPTFPRSPLTFRKASFPRYG